jgi:aspartate/methionine/tyrosine aminotransferase
MMYSRPSSQRTLSLQSAIMQELQSHFTKNTISLAQGVPFFPPPSEALEVVRSALDEPSIHRYSPDAGLPELREALVGKLAGENGIDVELQNVMATCGANQAFMNAILAIAEPGDEIILLRPYYFNHEMALRLAGIDPVFVDVDENYQPVPENVEKAISARTRAVVTVSPNNPTGAVYDGRRIGEINRLCWDDGIYHISDETYEYFTFNGAVHHSPGAWDQGQTITLHSFSKAYGMPGWRIGYLSYPAELEEGLLKVQDTLVICPSVIGQRMALECLKIGQRYVDPFLRVMDQSRNVILASLTELTDILSVPRTWGGYYFYVRIDGSELSGTELAIRLIKEHDVAVVPGEPFGAGQECCLRLSYGNVRPDTAEEGMVRFAKGVREIIG